MCSSNHRKLIRLGRIEAQGAFDQYEGFLQNVISNLQRQNKEVHASARISKEMDDPFEANEYKSMFEKAFQYFQSRCQHHIHKLVNGKRVVPNACRSKRKPTECQHEAPWSNRVSPPWMTFPLLVCKGIAKKFRLRCGGFRNWLGQTILLCNEN